MGATQYCSGGARLKISFCEIFGVVQFSTFSTLSAHSCPDATRIRPSPSTSCADRRQRHRCAPSDPRLPRRSFRHRSSCVRPVQVRRIHPPAWCGFRNITPQIEHRLVDGTACSQIATATPGRKPRQPRQKHADQLIHLRVGFLRWYQRLLLFKDADADQLSLRLTNSASAAERGDRLCSARRCAMYFARH